MKSARSKKQTSRSHFLRTFMPVLLTVTTMVGYLLLRQSAEPLRVAEVTTIPACTGFVGGSVSSDSLEPGSTVQVTCDFGKADLDCVKPMAAPYDFTSCTAAGYEGTVAKFDCVVPDKFAHYSQFCTLVETEACQAASLNSSCRNYSSSFVVESAVTPPTKPAVSTACDGTSPLTNITWDGTGSPEGFWVHISENTDHSNFYQKLVPTGKSTNTDGFTGASASNYGEPLSLSAEKTYHAWVFNGNISSKSLSFSPESCPAAPPKPTGLKHSCNADGTKVTLTWDDVSPAQYQFALNYPGNDTSTDWFIPNSTDVWRGGDYDSATYTLPVIPNKKYTWWVKSNTDGPSSTLSDKAEAEFTCLSPSPIPSASPTPLVTFRHDKSTCTTLSFGWDKLNGVSGYIVDISETSDFKDVKSSGVLQSTISGYTFDSLKVNQTYYARISAANIYDFPRYTKLAAVKTATACVNAPASPTPTPKGGSVATPKPTVKASPTAAPKASVKPSAAAPAGSLTPTAFEDKRFENVNPELPASGETVKPASPLARFLLWFFSLFGK